MVEKMKQPDIVDIKKDKLEINYKNVQPDINENEGLKNQIIEKMNTINNSILENTKNVPDKIKNDTLLVGENLVQKKYDQYISKESASYGDFVNALDKIPSQIGNFVSNKIDMLSSNNGITSNTEKTEPTIIDVGKAKSKGEYYDDIGFDEKGRPTDKQKTSEGWKEYHQDKNKKE